MYNKRGIEKIKPHIPDNRFDKTVRINIEANEEQHKAMKELARRRRVHIAVEYDRAVSQYLLNLDNFIDKSIHEIAKKKVG